MLVSLKAEWFGTIVEEIRIFLDEHFHIGTLDVILWLLHNRNGYYTGKCLERPERRDDSKQQGERKFELH